MSEAALAELVSLGLFLRHRFEPLEADFLRFYRIDLREALWGSDRIGARRLRSLISALPPDSATVREIRGPAADWSTTDELLATLIEAVDATSWRAVMPHMKKNARLPKPVRIPRPGETARRKKRKATVSELRELFGGSYVPKEAVNAH